MARRKPPAPKSRKPAKPSPPRRAKAPAAKPAPVEAADKPGMPLEAAAAVMTGVLLIAAILLVFVEKGKHYGEGPFKSMFGG